MSSGQFSPPSPSRSVTVLDDAVPEGGWQAVEIGRRVRIGGVEVSARWQDLAFTAWPVPSRSRRRAPPAVLRDGRLSVPTSAFVCIGREVSRAVAARASAGSANDNGRGRMPSLRDMMVLALLAATVAGAFWSGRLHAAQRVIVVPGPSLPRSVVT